MLAVHWSPVKNTSQILRNGISIGRCAGERVGVYCMPLSGFSKADKQWADLLYSHYSRVNCNGFVFRVEEGDLPATFACWDDAVSINRVKNMETLADIGREYRYHLACSIAPLVAELNRDLVKFVRTRPYDPIVKEKLTPQETNSFLEKMDILHRKWVDKSDEFDEPLEEFLKRCERYDLTEDIPFGKPRGKEKLESQGADSFRKKLDLLLKILKLKDLELSKLVDYVEAPELDASERDEIAEEILAEAARRKLSRAELSNPIFRRYALYDVELVLSRPIAPDRIIRVISRSNDSGRARVRKFRNRDDLKE